MSEQTQFVGDGVVIVADDLVVEVFSTAFERSVRVPCVWLGVRVEAKKHDEFDTQFGMASPPDQPLYGPDVKLSFYSMVFTLPMAEEPRLRAFFADVAARSGRAS